jgi:hypothetical protein
MRIGRTKTVPTSAIDEMCGQCFPGGVSTGTVKRVSECVWLLARLKPQPRSGLHAGATSLQELSAAMMRNAAFACLSQGRGRVPTERPQRQAIPGNRAGTHHALPNIRSKGEEYDWKSNDRKEHSP